MCLAQQGAVRERVVEENDGQWRRRHRFLTSHSRRAGDDRRCLPSALTSRERPHAAVQREQVEESHHRLGALRDVVDGLGLQWVQHPDERGDPRQVRGLRDKRGSNRRKQ
jgi:hypothetical protein